MIPSLWGISALEYVHCWDVVAKCFRHLAKQIGKQTLFLFSPCIVFSAAAKQMALICQPFSLNVSTPVKIYFYEIQ